MRFTVSINVRLTHPSLYLCPLVCSLDTEVTISPYLQYTSNLTKDISSLVYCLTMFVVCHMFVLKYYLRPIFNSF